MHNYDSKIDLIFFIHAKYNFIFPLYEFVVKYDQFCERHHVFVLFQHEYVCSSSRGQ